MSDGPLIRTASREGVLKFLEYLIDGVRSGHVSSYTSAFLINGVGRHGVTTDDPSAIPFDLSDLEDTTPAESPNAKAAENALFDPPEPKL